MFDVQFITHFTASISYPDSARIALEGGCRWVQLRMKDVSEEELKNTAMHVQELCRQYGATFIIDDRVDLVKEIGADGVHLGKLDMPIKEARKMLGKGFIIGGTANTFADIATRCRWCRLHRLRPFPFHNYQAKVITYLGTGRLPLHTRTNAGGRSNHPYCCYRWNHTRRHSIPESIRTERDSTERRYSES